MRPNLQFTYYLTAVTALGLLVAEPAAAGVWGSPKFTMSQSDDRFSADGLSTISSEGNRISRKSIAGGTHIDKQGVYLNPIAIRNRITGEIISLHFELFNLTDRISGMGAPNALGRPVRVSFLTGEGAPMVLQVKAGEQKYGETHCNAPVMGCLTSLTEAGVVPISLDEYRRLMAATVLAIKIDGTERSHIYEAGDVANTFIPNLTAFYNAHLAGAQ